MPIKMPKIPSIRQIPKKYIRIFLIVMGVLVLAAGIAGTIAYNKREALLRAAMAKAIRKAKTDYGLNVTIGEARFAGLSTVAFKKVNIVPEQRDSLAHIEDLRVGVKLWPLLFGDVKLAELKLNKGWVHLIKKDTLSNYDFIFRKNAEDTTASTERSSLATLANNLLNQMLYKIPDDMDVRDFDLNFRDDTTALDLFTSSATIDDGEVKSTIKVNGLESVWHVEGEVDPGDKQLNLMLYAEGKKVELPILEQKYGLKLNFDTIQTEMKRASKSGDELEISGSWSVKNLLINHKRIAANDIIVPSGSIDAEMIIGENYIALDSSSVIHMKNIKANPFIRYTLGKNKIYELKLRTGEMDAQELFDSFPIGVFESLEGIKVAGKLQYDLDFYLDASKPDDVVFNSRLRNIGFKVNRWGKTNLQKINAPFVYTPYEYGKPMRDIIVGPQNPDYVPIGQISPYLRNALLTAEDPSFYSHNGFVEESIRKSIATNFKEKAFKRGGSTISMQLVKNVFLNRQKTIARKIEEILIVWIMENTDVSTKNRMFEVYLNLIEWGRNVYGIGEAARFYFGKHPADLSLGESLYLARIVPKPKSGLFFFEGDGSLKPWVRGYFSMIGGLMARRGYIPADTSAYGFYSVRLREALRSGAPLSTDSLSADSLLMDDADEEPGLFDRLFGPPKKDTASVKQPVKPKVVPIDTVKAPLTKREQRRQEREERRKKGNND